MYIKQQLPFLVNNKKKTLFFQLYTLNLNSFQDIDFLINGQTRLNATLNKDDSWP